MQNGITRFLLLFVLTLSYVCAYADNTQYSPNEVDKVKLFFIPGVIIGDLAVDSKYTYSGINEERRVVGPKIAARLLYKNFLLDLGLSTSIDLDIFNFSDGLSNDQYFIFAGFQLPINEHNALNLKIGRAYWKVTLEEGAFLHPGPEQSKEYSGYDSVYAVDLLLLGSRKSSFDWFISYQRNKFDVGEMSALTIAVAAEIRNL